MKAKNRNRDNGNGIYREARPSVASGSWTQVVGEPPLMQWIHKDKLRIEDYQRKTINQKVVSAISACFNWRLFGVLLVEERPDGTPFVYEGQHRLLGARRRQDIELLPCSVVKVVNKQEAAKAFEGVNTFRTPLLVRDRYNTQLKYEDEVALAVDRLVRMHGYTCAGQPGANGRGIRFISELMNQYRRDANVCFDMFSLCARMYEGKEIANDIFSGLCHLELAMRKKGWGSLLDRHNEKTLLGRRPDEIVKEIRRVKSLSDTQGYRARVQGIRNILNHRRSTNKIRCPYT